MNINDLLKCVQRTNPTMTKDELVKKLNESYVSSFALIITFYFVFEQVKVIINAKEDT